MRYMSIIGIVAIVAGVALLGMGYNGATAPLGEVTEAITGTYPDRTQGMLLGGGALALFGVLLIMFGGSARARG